MEVKTRRRRKTEFAKKRDCRKISETKIVYEFPVFKEKRPVKAALPKR